MKYFGLSSDRHPTRLHLSATPLPHPNSTPVNNPRSNTTAGTESKYDQLETNTKEGSSRATAGPRPRPRTISPARGKSSDASIVFVRKNRKKKIVFVRMKKTTLSAGNPAAKASKKDKIKKNTAPTKTSSKKSEQDKGAVSSKKDPKCSWSECGEVRLYKGQTPLADVAVYQVGPHVGLHETGLSNQSRQRRSFFTMCPRVVLAGACGRWWRR